MFTNMYVQGFEERFSRSGHKSSAKDNMLKGNCELKLTSNLHSAIPMDTIGEQTLSRKLSEMIRRHRKKSIAYLRDMIKFKRRLTPNIVISSFA